jgi:hypothetical protein
MDKYPFHGMGGGYPAVGYFWVFLLRFEYLIKQNAPPVK